MNAAFWGGVSSLGKFFQNSTIGINAVLSHFPPAISEMFLVWLFC